MIENEDEGDEPLVSVIITTYNRPSYLRDAVKSVREQTYDRMELVVVDDHSDTPASQILDDIDTERFVDSIYIRHETNRGANAARNTGIDVSSGEYLAFLDDDDQWETEKIARQVGVFRSNEDVGVVYTGLRASDGESQWTEIPPAIEENITKALLCRNIVGSMSVVMVRADVAKETPLDERFPSWADLEWYISLSTKTRFERIPEPLVRYEFDSHNRLSDSFEKEQRSYELFTAKFDRLAAQYGRPFRRKMHGWAAHRVGTDALYAQQYRLARQYLTTAVTWYPFEPQFLKYLLAAVGGQHTYKLGRAVGSVITRLDSR